MADQQHPIVLNVDYPLGGGDVILGGSQWYLHDRDHVAFCSQAVMDPAPGAAVDVSTVHKNDVLQIGERHAGLR
jgi:hypothetical protein